MRYYIIAGEASGDLHGSNLIRGLAAEDGAAQLRFWGGDMMLAAARENGVQAQLVRHYRDGAVMGFTEVLAKGRRLLRNVEFCKSDILAWKPDVVVLIDYPGFNMKIAEFCHRHGIRVFYYIPQDLGLSRGAQQEAQGLGGPALHRLPLREGVFLQTRHKLCL